MATGLTDQDRRRIEETLDCSVSAKTRAMYPFAWRSFEDWAQTSWPCILRSTVENVGSSIWLLFGRQSLGGRQDHKAAKRVAGRHGEVLKVPFLRPVVVY